MSMGNPAYQNLSPVADPDPVTPADSPGDASGYASVSPSGQGTAPYDIAAPDDEAAITAACGDAYAVNGDGVMYPRGSRQTAAETLLDSPAGFSAGGGTSGYDITQGWAGSGADTWPGDVQPPELFDTPVQGTGDYPGTMQDGLQAYGT